MARGPLIILSGPSGSGKTTVTDRLLQDRGLPVRRSISATTRPPRDGERDGVDYYFVPELEFRRKMQAGEFLEWAEVFGKFYGTPREPVERLRDQGLGALLVIDVQGAEKVRQACPDHVSIFLRTSSFEVLEKRLRQRHTEDEASIQQRLATARLELGRANEYTFQVVNDDLEDAVRNLRAVIEPFLRERIHA